MSIALPTMRLLPYRSVAAGAALLSPASMAWLPTSRKRKGVDPPGLPSPKPFGAVGNRTGPCIDDRPNYVASSRRPREFSTPLRMAETPASFSFGGMDRVPHGPMQKAHAQLREHRWGTE